RLRGDRERAINAIAAAVRADDVALAAMRRRADDRAALQCIRGTPANRRRRTGAVDRMMRRQSNVLGRCREVDAHLYSAMLQYTPSARKGCASASERTARTTDQPSAVGCGEVSDPDASDCLSPRARGNLTMNSL